MASHHPYAGCCHQSTATSSAVYCCCPNYSYSYTTPCHNPVPTDPHILHQHHPPIQPHLYSLYSNPTQYVPQNFHQHVPSDYQREEYFRELHHHRQGEGGGISHAQPIVSSLLRRIAALESSLRQHSSSSSQSLRDAAARTIQTHFRAFLVRRSRTLRQLKDLAAIKSSINILKSSVSDNNHFDLLALSHKALHLLLKLDSIQGDDPMIRDGKRSISRELIRFLDLIEGIAVQRSELSSGFNRKNARQGENKKSRDLYNNQKMGTVSSRELGTDKRLEDLVNRIEALYTKVPRENNGEEDEELESPRLPLTRKSKVPQIRKGGILEVPNGIQAKAKKNVKFSEDGNVYYVPRRRNEIVFVEDSNSDEGSDSFNVKKKLEGALRREAEEVGGISFKDTEDDEEAHSDDQVSTKSSEDGERSSAYSAPLPVKMEARSDVMNKSKTAKLVE